MTIDEIALLVYEFVDDEVKAGNWVPGIPQLIHGDIQTYSRLSAATIHNQKKYMLEQVMNWYEGFKKFKDDKIAPASKAERKFGERLTTLLKEREK